MPPPPPYGYAPVPPGYPPQPVKQPRPRARVGGLLMLVGLALAVAGCILPWVNSSDGSLNGFDVFYCDDELECVATSDPDPTITDLYGNSINEFESPAIAAVFGIVIMTAFAIVLLAAGRVLAIAIIALIMSIFGVLAGLLFVALAAGTEFVNGFEVPADGIGIGVLLHLLGALVTAAASIVALVQRNRPEPAVMPVAAGPWG